MDTPVPVVPSPKSQAYDAMVPGAVSLEADALTVQVACGQLTVNDASGATFGPDVWSAPRTTVHIVALREEAALVAVRAAVGPVPTGASESDATAVIRPEPVPRARLLCTWPAGTLQPVAAPLPLSAQ